MMPVSVSGENKRRRPAALLHIPKQFHCLGDKLYKT